MKPGWSSMSSDRTVEGRTLVQGSTLRLAFSNGQVSANAGCNSMSGPYRIDEARLVVDELRSDRRGPHTCPGVHTSSRVQQRPGIGECRLQLDERPVSNR